MQARSLLLPIIVIVALGTSVAIAQALEIQTLHIDHIEGVSAPEPPFVQIILVESDGRKIALRMTPFGAMDLARKIERLGH
jgi:hypothetical protein